MAFCKFILQKEINDTNASDIYMNLYGKLQGVLDMLKSPSHSMGDSMEFSQNEDLRQSGFDMQKRATLMSTYGMTTQEIGELQLNL